LTLASGSSNDALKRGSSSIMLTRRRHDGLKCVDVFCGAGALTRGLEEEGVEVVAGIDFDPVCRYPYEANNDGRFVLADVSRLSGDAVANMLGGDEPKVLAGCPPCQPFSTYSQRYEVRKMREYGLLSEFARIVGEVRPDVVAMENVPSITRHEVFEEFVEALEGWGYHVWYGVVDASKYGTPQRRRRLVLLASIHGPIELIPPTHETPRTVREAIGDLPPLAAGEADPDDPLHVAASLSPKNLARIRASLPGGTWRDWPGELVAACHTNGTGRSYGAVYGRMEWDAPAPTITTQAYNYGSGRFGHPEQDRAISLREAALLQGFPRDYSFVPPGEKVTFKNVGRLVGNAVPVDLARAIGRSIVAHLEAVLGVRGGAAT